MMKNKFIKKLPHSLSGKNPALILGLSCTGLGVARCLGRKHVPVIGIDRKHFEIGSYSRYCQTIVSPDAELLATLIEISKKCHRKPVLFPTDDEYVLFVSENRELLHHYYLFALPAATLINAMINKAQFYQLAQTYREQVPWTLEWQTVAVDRHWQNTVDYPCIVKPTQTHIFKKHYPNKKAFIVNDEEELLQTITTLQSAHIPTIIQELVRGRDDEQFSITAYLNQQSQPLCCFSARKVRQQPISFGTGSYVISEENAALRERAVRFLTAIGFHGIAEVEFRRDSKDGEFKMIEINPRPWAQNILAASSGTDIVYSAYQDLIGDEPEHPIPGSPKIAWVFLVKDIVSCFHYFRKGEITIREWMNSYQVKLEHAIYAPDDVLPAIMLPFYLLSKIG